MSLHTLEEIYSYDVSEQEIRYENAREKFSQIFGTAPQRYFSAPGRTEVGGNHTDHNCGRVLAAGVSLDVIAMVEPSDDNVIQIKSEGFPMDTVDISDLEVKENEKNTSAALIRGVAAGFAQRGFKIGGFRAYTTSNVLKGSGLSSSAAFEVLVGNILNGLYNSHSVSAVEIAKISQYAENAYFGKPSGLMDQMASSVGGFITIDFKDTDSPVIKAINFDLELCGYCLCIVDTKGDHADLTPEYAAIPAEMKSVAEFFGKKVLREISREELMENISAVREKCGDRAVLRALHFLDDNDRVEQEEKALSQGDVRRFLKLVTESGRSSYMYLQNIYASSAPERQGLSLALYTAQRLLDGEGAYRVHGGGFAGTIQAFVPQDKLETFRTEMDRIFGSGSCHVLTVRPFGGTEVELEI